jgi:hypothetical protein
MIAICPAGPPKLMKPSLSQNASAAAKETVGAGAALPAGDTCELDTGAFSGAGRRVYEARMP